MSGKAKAKETAASLFFTLFTSLFMYLLGLSKREKFTLLGYHPQKGFGKEGGGGNVELTAFPLRVTMSYIGQHRKRRRDARHYNHTAAREAREGPRQGRKNREDVEKRRYHGRDRAVHRSQAVPAVEEESPPLCRGGGLGHGRRCF